MVVFLVTFGGNGPDTCRQISGSGGNNCIVATEPKRGNRPKNHRRPTSGSDARNHTVATHNPGGRRLPLRHDTSFS